MTLIGQDRPTVERFGPALEWIDQQHPQMIRRVTEWANVNSGTHNLAGLSRMAELLKPEFSALGGTCESLPLEPLTSIAPSGETVSLPLSHALRFCKRPDAPLRIFLCIHMDTVYGVDHPFQTTTQLNCNTLRGPGVVDAKGGLAVMLTALQAFERSPFAANVGWEILINPDEEIGSIGSGPLLVEGAKRNHVGLVFEPTLPDGTMVDRRRGIGNFTAIVRGRSAHAGRDFGRGRNAVVAAARIAIELHALNAALPGITVNVGRLEGGGALNVVPDLALCRVNLRTSVPEDEPRAVAAMEEVLERARLEEGITATLHGAFTSPPKIPDDSTRSLMHVIESCGGTLSQPIKWAASGGACDGNKLAAAGLPTVDTLGPRGGDLHSPTEYLFLDSLPQRAKLTALLLMQLASGGGIQFNGKTLG